MWWHSLVRSWTSVLLCCWISGQHQSIVQTVHAPVLWITTPLDPPRNLTETFPPVRSQLFLPLICVHFIIQTSLSFLKCIHVSSRVSEQHSKCFNIIHRRLILVQIAKFQVLTTQTETLYNGCNGGHWYYPFHVAHVYTQRHLGRGALPDITKWLIVFALRGSIWGYRPSGTNYLVVEFSDLTTRTKLLGVGVVEVVGVIKCDYNVNWRDNFS